MPARSWTLPGSPPSSVRTCPSSRDRSWSSSSRAASPILPTCCGWAPGNSSCGGRRWAPTSSRPTTWGGSIGSCRGSARSTPRRPGRSSTARTPPFWERRSTSWSGWRGSSCGPGCRPPCNRVRSAWPPSPTPSSRPWPSCTRWTTRPPAWASWAGRTATCAARWTAGPAATGTPAPTTSPRWSGWRPGSTPTRRRRAARR